MSNYHKLYTPQDSAVVFIDQQPQMTFGVSSIDRALLVNNVTLLAKAAKEYGVPVIITAVETESFSGYLWPQLLDVFPGQPVIERTSMNSWDVVEDCCGATSPAAQEVALSRMVQAGATRLTTIPALLEWQRDWARHEHYNNLMGLLKQQAGAYGVGVEYACTMVHHAPQSAVKPQIVPKKVAH